MSKFLKLKMTNLLVLAILSSENVSQLHQRHVEPNFWIVQLLGGYLFYVSTFIEHCIRRKTKTIRK